MKAILLIHLTISIAVLILVIRNSKQTKRILNSKQVFRITLFICKNDKTIFKESYHSFYQPNIGDTIDLEFIRNRSGYIFEEQYATIKEVEFYYSNPYMNPQPIINIRIKAEIIKES